MNEETDREDRNRRLVKMTSEEFATGMNRALRRTVQGWFNRETVLLALILLWVIGMSIYRYFYPAF